jgi:hypothetical protein
MYLGSTWVWNVLAFYDLRTENFTPVRKKFHTWVQTSNLNLKNTKNLATRRISTPPFPSQKMQHQKTWKISPQPKEILMPFLPPASACLVRTKLLKKKFE